MGVHTTADDPSKYRQEKEVKKWRKRDPISRFQRYLTDKGLLSEEDIEALEEDIKDDIDAAWREAEQQMDELGDPLDMFEHLYAEPPPTLREQREACKQFLETRKEAGHD
jgi:TPP-dependent pyruvate/acetoin dehydrogenase alpha subunit